MISKLLTRSLLLARTTLTPILQQKPRFAFSTVVQEGTEGEVQELDRAENFYRNSIRRININDKGRGKFTEHHLIRLSKLTEKASQLPLLFEGYYNYLGHFTVISSRTVDKMLEKALSFEQAALPEVLQVFQNHNYLGYFPSYKSTLLFLKAAEKDEEIFKKLIHILHESPLIKFNGAVVEALIGYLKEEPTQQAIFSSIAKLLIQRSALHLIDEQLNPSALLNVLATTLSAQFAQSSCHIMNSNQYVLEYLNSLKLKQESSDDLHNQLAIVGLAFGARSIFYDNLVLIQKQKHIATLLKYVQNCSEAYSRSVVGYLKEQELSQATRGLVEGLKVAAKEE